MIKINDNVQEEVAKYMRYKRKRNIVMDVFTVLMLAVVVALVLSVLKDISNLRI